MVERHVHQVQLDSSVYVFIVFA